MKVLHLEHCVKSDCQEAGIRWHRAERDRLVVAQIQMWFEPGHSKWSKALERKCCKTTGDSFIYRSNDMGTGLLSISALWAAGQKYGEVLTAQNEQLPSQLHRFGFDFYGTRFPSGAWRYSLAYPPGTRKMILFWREWSYTMDKRSELFPCKRQIRCKLY